ncbi:MAG TPA: hypothetical protein PKE47_00005, partial [Verrucomicrobiota bacterium]|nr:hypothetical protein [Verrucomicrobiota bacterium]
STAMKFILPVLAMVCSAFFTLSALVFCMGMGANAKPPEIRALKLWMLGLSLLGGAGVTIGIFLIRAGHPGWASLAAFVPTVIFAIILAIALLK